MPRELTTSSLAAGLVPTSSWASALRSDSTAGPRLPPKSSSKPVVDGNVAAPGTGANFSSFGIAVINDAGTVAFERNVASAGSSGLWRNAPGVAALGVIPALRAGRRRGARAAPLP